MATNKLKRTELDVLNHATECPRTMAHTPRLRMVQRVKSAKAWLQKVSCLLRSQADEPAF
jgi:hypothetical protein